MPTLFISFFQVYLIVASSPPLPYSTTLTPNAPMTALLLYLLGWFCSSPAHFVYQANHLYIALPLSLLLLLFQESTMPFSLLHHVQIPLHVSLDTPELSSILSI